MPEAEKPIREPRALSTEYHRARKQLMLWSAILLIWALIGVDLEKAKDAQGGVGAIIGSLKSPQAVPWALVILIGYFVFKCTVEWYQCTETRRNLRVAKIDFSSAWLVAILSYVLFFGQLISRIQFANWIGSSRKFVSFGFGLIMMSVFGYFAQYTRHMHHHLRKFQLDYWFYMTRPLVPGSIIVGIVLLVIYTGRVDLSKWTLLGILSGLGVSVAAGMWLRLGRWRITK